ncbi:MAG TPA: hypothetical protein DEA71_10745, partial [Nitrospira sp.]|nr:hypothetical protein [Nitrospira sp.]
LQRPPAAFSRRSEAQRTLRQARFAPSLAAALLDSLRAILIRSVTVRAARLRMGVGFVNTLLEN